MEKYTKLDYEKAAYEYYLHNELLEDTVKLLDQVGDIFKIFLAILSAISVMLIIGITLIVKISNI